VLAGLAVQRLDEGLLDAARSDLEAALTIAREVGDRRVEGNGRTQSCSYVVANRVTSRLPLRIWSGQVRRFDIG
jgi:hypothetical protein